MPQLFSFAVVCLYTIIMTLPNCVSTSAVLSYARPNLLRNWQVFNVADMNDRLRAFDRRMTSEETTVHCNLAVSFGRLTSNSVRTMDGHLKVMLSGTLRAFNRDPESRKSWENVMATMKNNPLIEEIPGETVHREDGYRIVEDNIFKVDGSPEQYKIDHFRRWFVNFINDNDVIQDTSIDIDALGNIVAQTGATIVSFETFFHKREYAEKQVIDIGILRFPDLDNPFMKVYRIQLKVWSDCTRTLMVQYDRNGVNGIFDSAKFRPRASVMASIRPQIMDQASAEVDELFS